MAKMEDLPFTLRLLTPAFAGSAPLGTRPVVYMKSGGPVHDSTPYHPVDPCGIRVPTLRGVLEFWHRSRFGNLGGAAVYERQAQVFGSAETGQGLSIRPTGHSDFRPRPLTYKSNIYGLTYLGYGPLQLLRVPDSRRRDGVNVATSYHQSGCHDAIPVDQGEPWFSFRARGTRAQIAELRRALALLHLFGGIGSRSRRGWGSVVVDVEGESAAAPGQAPEALRTWFAARLVKAMGDEQVAAWSDGGEPEFSAFGAQSRVLFTKVSHSHLDVLDEFFRQLKTVRSVMDRSAIAKDDVRIEKRDALQRNGGITDVPRRLAFGLPYHPQQRNGWSIDYLGRDPEGGRDAGEVTRRASPLLLKVLRLDGQRLVGVALFLRSRFFGDAKLRIGAKDKPKTHSFPGYEAIDTLLDNSGWTELAMPGRP
jgi:CRISPR/Cas system CMR-associated protein Cmr1 (group 7 of RAMP superfamily)